MIVLLMGVSGSGKTTIGRLTAEQLGWSFVEGDDHHPPENIARLSAGIPLTDEDRLPWLLALAARIASARAAGEDVVVACSALRRADRDLLTAGDRRDVLLVWLTGDMQLIAGRMAGRAHFVAPSLLGSQQATLEPPDAGECGLVLSVELPPGALAADIVAAVHRADATPRSEAC